jgi:single-stranded DNA-specific DHH superfamily exonuclease
VFAYFAKQKVQNKLLIRMFEEYSKKDDLNNTVIGWDIQPKISSAIRTKDKKLHQYLFMALATEKDKYIDYVVDECKKSHTRQTNLVKEYLGMMDNIDESNHIIFEDITAYNFEPSYIGLVANRLCTKYNKPIILYRVHNKTEYGGSVRSPFDVQDIFINSGLFTFCNGHKSVFGVGFKKDKLDKLKEYVRTVELDDSIMVACSCKPKDIPSINYEYSDRYIDLFGKGLRCPQYHIQPFTIYNTDIQTLGKGGTIKFHKDGVDFISFFTSNDMKERLYMNVDEKVKLEIEIIGELGWNEFRGKKSKQCVISEIECRKVDEKEIDWNDIW